MLMLQGDILEDIELIENLEQTKRTAVDIEEKVKLAKQTEVSVFDCVCIFLHSWTGDRHQLSVIDDHKCVSAI